jgi:hypothetical protein
VRIWTDKQEIDQLRVNFSGYFFRFGQLATKSPVLRVLVTKPGWQFPSQGNRRHGSRMTTRLRVFPPGQALRPEA